MEASLVIYGALLSFGLNGLLLVGAINHYRVASRLAAEAKQMALRAMTRRR